MDTDTAILDELLAGLKEWRSEARDYCKSCTERYNNIRLDGDDWQIESVLVSRRHYELTCRALNDLIVDAESKRDAGTPATDSGKE